MAFDSLEAFLAMGGHGPYVWACYLVFFALSVVLIVWSLSERKAALRSIARRQSSTNKANTTASATADFARVNPRDTNG